MQVFITGTDTNVGKTIVSTWLCLHTKYNYWKPIQTGCNDGTDTELVQELGNIKTYPETYCYQAPVSPHLAAYMEAKEIKMENISLPTTEPIIVEGAGGVLVPINNQSLMIDVMVHLNIPVIVVACSTLGTINHTLLTIEALKTRKLNVLGVIMVGHFNPSNREAIEQYGQIKVLAELPIFETITTKVLQSFLLPASLQHTLGIQNESSPA